MPTTLHSSNPVPSNGVVVTSVNGGHKVTMTLAGVGTVRAEAQLWTKEEGSSAGKAGSVQVVTGTDTATATFTVETRSVQLWLQLISITPGTLFSATLLEIPYGDGIPSSTLEAILATTPVVGSRARATNAPGSNLEYTATGWLGFLGQFATLVALEAVTKTNIAVGCLANVIDVGTAQLPTGKAQWLISPATIPSP